MEIQHFWWCAQHTLTLCDAALHCVIHPNIVQYCQIAHFSDSFAIIYSVLDGSLVPNDGPLIFGCKSQYAKSQKSLIGIFSFLYICSKIYMKLEL